MKAARQSLAPAPHLNGHGSAAQIRKLTIEAQLHREFADRLNMEADAWATEARGKRRKAIEHQLQAHKLTVQAGELREPPPPKRAGKAAS